MIGNILAAVLTGMFVLLLFGAIATVWMRRQARFNYRCPCGRTFELRAEALHHERLVHRRPARLSQIEKLP